MVEPLGLVGLSALTRSVVFCGKRDACRAGAVSQPIPAKTDQPNGPPAIRSDPDGYGARAP